MKTLGRHRPVWMLGGLRPGVFAAVLPSDAGLRSPAWYDEGGVGTATDSRIFAPRSAPRHQTVTGRSKHMEAFCTG